MWPWPVMAPHAEPRGRHTRPSRRSAEEGGHEISCRRRAVGGLEGCLLLWAFAASLSLGATSVAISPRTVALQGMQDTYRATHLPPLPAPSPSPPRQNEAHLIQSCMRQLGCHGLLG
ncbi:hypothetical protein E2C01_055941 [Portunus trituberculatus]|uniref:Uncharacterized protein n=1 Tax=Portunus trituberculatus TaxID=210409 RepID=A0A5B7GW34_PORTR|nr:hypothetical protein [Portunus trituberculatus]